MATYLYNPLTFYDSIRLIRLHGNPLEEAPLCCDIVECTLRDPLEYEAISYTWQGQKASRKLQCPSETLLITPNCEAALRRFRPWTRGDFRLLWIDAICINQEERDFAEKSRQVGLMGEIYTRARRTLVWLVPTFYDPETGADEHARNMRVCSWLSELAEVHIRSDKESRLAKLVDEAPVDGICSTFLSSAHLTHLP
jgi:hypothetical protein